MRFSFAMKLGLAMTLLAVMTTGGSVFWVYKQARELVISNLGNRLKDIGRTGAFIFDKQLRSDLAYLEEQIEKQNTLEEHAAELEAGLGEDETLEALPADVSNKLQESPQFQRVVQALRSVREGSRQHVRPLRDIPALHVLRLDENEKEDPPTLEYVYLLGRAPGYEVQDYIVYMADSDYLPAEDDGLGDPYEGNPIGNLTPPLTDEMWEGFAGEAVAEKNFTEDQWGDVVMSGYVPILDESGHVLAVLGMDYNVKSEANKISFLFYVCVGAVAGAFVLAVSIAIFMSMILNRPIKRLKEGAERVADRDFSAHVDVISRDELGVLAGTFNSMVDEIRDYTREILDLNQAYERFVPQEFLKHLGHDNITRVQLGDQVQREMTILFTDIRAFTTLSEKMTPVENFNFLNSYLSRVSPVIRKNNGFIDKFIGDAVMALFPNTVEDAVRGSVEIMQALSEFNHHREEQGREPIRIGIGVHTGKLMLGTIGEKMRMESTVIADAVNLASRLEGLTKKFGSNILISEYSVNAVKDVPGIYHRYLGSVRVKGKAEPVRVFEILNADSQEVIMKKQQTEERFYEGIRLFHKGKFGDAGQIFREIVNTNPGDFP
ncbi:MAG: HAMP domain-containing protein, partial [Leptospiraceae bacterium]|nr:HAMP domain-containing protein [Leptospiraceae bacterium]